MKPIFVEPTVQHRRALDELKRRTGKSIRELALEAIGDMAVKYGLVADPVQLYGWPVEANRHQTSSVSSEGERR